MEELTIIGKLIETNGTLRVTISKDIVDEYKLKKGDRIKLKLCL